MSESIIRLASQGSLEEELAELKVQLAALLSERDDLLLHVCKNIEMDFMLKIGRFEYEAFQAQCDYLRAKRKCEMLQALKNRQEKPDLVEIERLLDEELKEYMERLKVQFEEIAKAIERSQYTALTKDETKDLKQYYRQIIKRLHPDLHPDISDEELKLFHAAVAAYEAADLETVRMIYELLVDRGDGDIFGSHTLLKKRIEQLRVQIQQLEEQIENIKSNYPYIYKDLLQDEKWVAERQEMLKNTKVDFIKAKETYDKRIKELLR
ncbi:hypothetical protein [Streptococcus sp. S784/96/1]|uniref:hypothetical protein n=1 Tax=Streptococcus sp. S784/96/1 TaxID=2653499 RepID=UPI0013865F70|nr:hypothetical protein [Streptococcus sp. S784/96/1]